MGVFSVYFIGLNFGLYVCRCTFGGLIMQFLQFNGDGYEKKGFQLVDFYHVSDFFDIEDQEIIFNLGIGERFSVDDLSGQFYIKRVK